jgi:hypothetical protein
MTKGIARLATVSIMAAATDAVAPFLPEEVILTRIRKGRKSATYELRCPDCRDTPLAAKDVVRMVSAWVLAN